MYQKNCIYLWQNQVGEYAFLNGTEVLVLSEAIPDFVCNDGSTCTAWLTDSPALRSEPGDPWDMYAFEGDLVPKQRPTGLDLILGAFKVPELESV